MDDMSSADSHAPGLSDTGRRRGTLKVLLGAAPGVGKTYAMLNEGRRRQQRGTDVVVALVETHGRVQTEAHRQRTLRIEIEQQHFASGLHQGGAQVDRRRGLTNAAFLITHGYYARRAVRGQLLRFRKRRLVPTLPL